MGNSDIEKIVALTQQANKDLPKTLIPLSIVANGCNLHSLEDYLDAPLFYRADLKTLMIDQFISYVNSIATGSVFINDESMTAKAIFDMGTHEKPEWGRNVALLTMNKEDAYSSVLSQDKGQLDQDDFIDFIDDWSGNIEFFADDEEISNTDAINRIRRITIENTKSSTSDVQNFSQELSEMDKIEAKFNENAKPPEYFIFVCAPYKGLDKVGIVCKVRVHTTNGVGLSYRIVGLSDIKNKIVENFLTKLESGIEDVDVIIGDMTYQK